MTFRSKFQKPFPIFLISFIILFLAASIISTNRHNNYEESILTSPNPAKKIIENAQYSGWIAWWAEEKAYDFIRNNPNKIHTVSPVWFMINDDLKLENIGKADRENVISELKRNNIRVIPSLGSELNDNELSLFLRSDSKVNLTIERLATEISAMGADGIDVDLEGIKKEDKNYFTLFLSKLQKRLRKDNLIMSVTIHAQTKKIVWEGVEGQDLEWIGENADEVRIMTYDQHSGDTKPGPISSFDWLKEVINYNLKFMDKDKMVIGIPSYGYVWSEDKSEGLQFDEFNNFLKGREYKQKRDRDSGELTFSSDNFSGWLSDSQSMKLKISQAQKLGINRFIIWHLGGMDEKVFDKN